MSALASWSVRHRRWVLVGWLVVLIGLGLGAAVAGPAFSDKTALPSSESSTAYALLAQASPGSAAAATGNIAWHTQGVAVDDATIQQRAAVMLAQVAAQPGVLGVVGPYSSAGAGQVNVSAGTAFARVTVTDQVDVAQIRSVAERMAGAGVQVTLGGAAFTELPKPSPATEGVGIALALVILLVAFRSRWAAALPIVTGLVGVGASILTVVLGTHVLDLPTESITMASMIGLGVGIDYALFVVNRYRTALTGGGSVHDAVVRALDTSGRAVLFAGLTVVVALGGMVVVGLSMLTAMAMAAALAVLLTVATALTLLPALLATLGEKVLSSRQRAARATGEPARVQRVHTSRAGRWSTTVMRRPVPLALAGVAVLVTLAVPALSIRVGNADSSADPSGSHGREYYDMMTPAFGAGVDATLVLVAQTPDPAAATAFTQLVGRLGSVPDVAAVQAAPVQTGQPIAVTALTPSSSAQTVATQDLVRTLREDVIPRATAGTDLRVYVGGPTASNVDLADALTSKLPLYLGLIALLGFALLAVAFRSVLVPLVGALSNLLTIAVGLGVVTAVFQFGWGSSLLGTGSAAPIMWIVPVILTGVMFGLSMDYQVFLVSRMHEEWARTHDNRRAVRVGLRETLPVIVTAAAIMFCVFGAFGFAGQRIVAGMGVGLALAVVVDAFVTRLVVMPALLRLLGPRTWWYPRWAQRITLHLSVEGSDDPAGGDVRSGTTPGAASLPDEVPAAGSAMAGAAAPLEHPRTRES